MYVLVAIKRNKNHCYQFNSLNNPVVNARGRHCSSMNEAHVKSPVLLTLFSLGKWSLKMRLFESNRQIDPSVRRCRKWITYFSSPGEGQQPDPTPSPCFPLFFFFSLSLALSFHSTCWFTEVHLCLSTVREARQVYITGPHTNKLIVSLQWLRE